MRLVGTRVHNVCGRGTRGLHLAGRPRLQGSEMCRIMALAEVTAAAMGARCRVRCSGESKQEGGGERYLWQSPHLVGPLPSFLWQDLQLLCIASLFLGAPSLPSAVWQVKQAF